MRIGDDPATRARNLLVQMTTAEKISMLHGPPPGHDCCECITSPLCNYTGNVAPIERLGIPQVGFLRVSISSAIPCVSQFWSCPHFSRSR
jgi:hypothetical protein